MLVFRTILLFILFSVACGGLKAQAMEEEMQEYRLGFFFNKGIYLTFEEFKSNQPAMDIPFERNGSSISIFNDSAKKMMPVNPDKVWGYSDGKNIYIAEEGYFWKLVTIGKLSHFSAIVLTRFQTVDAFGFPTDRYSKTMNHLFFDFDDGEVKYLNKENLMPFLEGAAIESKSLEKKMKRDGGLILALKAVNQVHPIYFPSHE